MATHSLTVGQKLWFVPADPRQSSRLADVEVISIGRKWAVISNNCRIHVQTLAADGGNYGSPGRCWISREAWECRQQAVNAFEQLTRKLRFSPRDGVTLENIQQAASLLGITLD